ncbi:MAG TPA: AAA family ATPase [Acidimicrobiales bacterium]|nr:AAA family ATPase [Acidimicrobiales bacterium]
MAAPAGSPADIVEAVVANVARVVVGKESATRLALVCVAAGGHLLVEDVPGVGKTSLAKALAASFGLEWRRIQFTPDLLPSDVTGTTVYDRRSGRFEFRPGGVFANVVLGDEINRASPKTQAALLEAMEEGQVTVDSTTYALPSPFLVVATQNPAEHAGTYPLPESQLDRFLLRLHMGYPDRDAEIEMLAARRPTAESELSPVVEPGAVAALVARADAVTVVPALRGYVVDLAAATRRHPGLALGMSPRAALGLLRAAKALAASSGRDFATPDDVKAVAAPVLGHRLVLSADAAVAGAGVDDVLAEVVRSVPAPVSGAATRRR